MSRHACWFTLLLFSGAAVAQTVEITATRDRTRQLDTAATTVVGRDDLLRYGDTTLADALKRVPGITVSGVQGRGGEIRMRGLGNGYTQVLLNGQPVSASFSIDSVSPELIERVEVMRVATAELGTQAIAGSINIVLRKSASRVQREVKAGLSANRGELTPDLAAEASGKAVGWSYTMAGVFVGGHTVSPSTEDELGFEPAGALNLRRRTELRQLDVRPSLNLTPRVSWTLPNGDTLTWQNFLRVLKLDLGTSSRERTSVGEPTQFPYNVAVFHARAETVRSDLQWLHQTEDGGRWDVKLGANRFRRKSDFSFEGFASDAAAASVNMVDSTASEDNVTFGGKFSRTLGGHTLLAGWDAAHGRHGESRFEHGLAPVNELYGARLERLALFAQDDWSIAPELSLSTGLRWETLRTRTEGNVLDQVDQRTDLLSPLGQVLYKLSESQQLRAGVTRTFKMPTLANLAMRRYTVNNNNNPLSADQQGNPYLLPERAWGLDLAYERYFGKDAMVSASTYARRIDDVTIDRLGQVGATWISTPVNAGRAHTWGIELEAKYPLSAALDLRANAARNWSRVDSVPGPDNRLASQVPFSASIGIDHRMTALPLTLGATYNFQGGGPARLSERTGAWTGVQRELGMVAVLRLDARSQWRMSVANALGQDHLAQASFADRSGRLQTTTTTPTSPTVRLAFEHKFE
jgi:outer membrane receptor protein involved in Fe transport